MNWSWFEVDAASFAGRTFEDVSGEFRSGNPVGLVTRSRRGPEIAVVNLFAPVNHVYWACNWSQSHSRTPSLIHDSPSADLTELGQGAQQMLRDAKAVLGSPQVRWFETLAQVAGKTRRSVPSLSRSVGAYLESGRWVNTAVRVERLTALKQVMEEQLAQFGKFAFWACDERVRFIGPAPISSVWEARLGGLGNSEFHLASRHPQVYLAIGQAVVDELIRTISALESGIPFDYLADAMALVGPPRFGRIPADWDVSNDIRALEKQILACRARLVRLLAWPSHYHPVCQVVRPVLDQATWEDVDHPYRLMSELVAYLSDMEDRYPLFRS